MNLFRPACLLLLLSSCRNDAALNRNWSAYGGGPGNTRYADLSVIDTGNVHLLEPAWEYHTGDADTINHSQIQCNPIIIDHVLYGTTPQMKLFALDAATGEAKWTFNPFDSIRGSKNSFFIMNNCRGVSYWTDGKADKRIFYTAGSDLYAIDATTGRPV